MDHLTFILFQPPLFQTIRDF